MSDKDMQFFTYSVLSVPSVAKNETLCRIAGL